MGVNLRDAVKFNYGFQGALQGAGTPNQAGLGAFIPLHVGSNGVAFVDVLVNANFSDYSGYSSIINTDVSGTTFSTSTRLGTAGSTATALGCLASMRVMTADQWQQGA
jgi:hypothetical protein